LGEEDLRAYSETLRNPTTLALGEEISSLSFGEEFTTEALGEEGPTTTSGENPSPAEFSREGGPFGAY
jgi:hypothetical protein